MELAFWSNSLSLGSDKCRAPLDPSKNDGFEQHEDFEVEHMNTKLKATWHLQTKPTTTDMTTKPFQPIGLLSSIVVNLLAQQTEIGASTPRHTEQMLHDAP